VKRDEGVLDDFFRLLAVTEEEHRQTDERRTVGPEEDVQGRIALGGTRCVQCRRARCGFFGHDDLPTSIVHV
jgi:hypothetical protein